MDRVVIICAEMNLFEMLDKRMHIVEMNTTAGVVAAQFPLTV
jgi:hypothetical protein